jgi:hypothetical protein
MVPCRNNGKILFVIGDCGDNEVHVPENVIHQLKKFKRLAIYFIQTPKWNTNKAYEKAYIRFKSQSLKILKNIYPESVEGHFIHPEDYFLQLSSPAEVTQRLIPLLKGFTKSRQVNELLKRLRAGEALRPYIIKRMKDGDLPVLYWNWVTAGRSEIGKQWTEKVDHRVIEAYISPSKDWIEEIWITERDLLHYRNLLGTVARMRGKDFSKQRDILINAMRLELQTIVGEPPLKDTGQTIKEYITQRGALPIRQGSPFLAYTLGEIRNVKTCEIRRLHDYIKNIWKLLNMIHADPSRKIEFTTQPYPEEQCRLVSPKGRKIPMITHLNNDTPLGPSQEYKYRHVIGNNVGYWIPKRFLP